MIDGRFGDNKELFFEIQLVAANDEEFLVEALFDTGFTDGWLAGCLRLGRFGMVFNGFTGRNDYSTRFGTI
ncbi:hypothetical protein NIES4101_26980 (plasmid) [Calothrix sp. NIES-4101]|nr:hypothetical protein NIES4101_26980 [Calothrix sp. NIES-4101]